MVLLFPRTARFVSKLGHAGRLGYLDAISDLIDFRKIQGTSSETVLRNLACTEVYLKRAQSGENDATTMD